MTLPAVTKTDDAAGDSHLLMLTQKPIMRLLETALFPGPIGENAAGPERLLFPAK